MTNRNFLTPEDIMQQLDTLSFDMDSFTKRTEQRLSRISQRVWELEIDMRDLGRKVP